MYNITKKQHKVKSWHKMPRKRRRVQAQREFDEILKNINVNQIFTYTIGALFFIEVGAQITLFVMKGF